MPGVAAVSAVDHSYAYVGPDLQDVVRHRRCAPADRRRPARLLLPRRHRREMLARLARRPDAVLVSKETITDYSLKLGDLLRLRVLDHGRARSHRRLPRRRGRAGVPSAPKDSFMVANLATCTVTHERGPNVVFVARRGDPASRRAAGRGGDSARRHGEGHSRADRPDGQLDHHSRPPRHQPDRGALRARARHCSDGTLRAVALAERRREFATMAALGASLRQTAAFLWTRGRARRSRGARARGPARLAARRDARRDAAARLRPAARPPGRPWAFLAASLPPRSPGGSPPPSSRRWRSGACSWVRSCARNEPSAGLEPILVVEDDDVLRNVLIRGLREEGFPVAAAATGTEALARVEQTDCRTV